VTIARVTAHFYRPGLGTATRIRSAQRERDGP
jgi:hypothetical protein